MRKISFKLLTQVQLESIETDARTLGQLKSEINSNRNLSGKIRFGEVQLVDRDTKVTYDSLDDAILPATDCIMFVVPKKTKSGAKPDLDSMTFTQLKELAEKLEEEDDNLMFDTDGTAAELYDELNDYYDNLPDVAEEVKTIKDSLIEVTDIINDILPRLDALNIEEATALRVTTNQLQKEIESVTSRV
jgi:hypothetical protein